MSEPAPPNERLELTAPLGGRAGDGVVDAAASRSPSGERRRRSSSAVFDGLKGMTGRLVAALASIFALLSATPVVALAEEPEKVAVCALKTDPAAYNHRLIEVTGFVSHGFEDFSLFDPECLPWMGVWLEYGGTVKSGTMYCCGPTAGRSRRKPLIVEKIPIPLVRDDTFERFDNLIQRHRSVVLRATLVGRFFAGRRVAGENGQSWEGYGHMGCCSLLAVQQVRVVDPVNRNDVDYDPYPYQPRIDGVGCWVRELTAQWTSGSRLKGRRRTGAHGLSMTLTALP